MVSMPVEWLACRLKNLAYEILVVITFSLKAPDGTNLPAIIGIIIRMMVFNLFPKSAVH